MSGQSCVGSLCMRVFLWAPNTAITLTLGGSCQASLPSDFSTGFDYTVYSVEYCSLYLFLFGVHFICCGERGGERAREQERV